VAASPQVIRHSSAWRRELSVRYLYLRRCVTGCGLCGGRWPKPVIDTPIHVAPRWNRPYCRALRARAPDDDECKIDHIVVAK